MKSRARGGAVNPHGTVSSLLLSLAKKRRTLAQCFDFIRAIPSESTRAEFGRALKNFVDYLGSRGWEPGVILNTNPVEAPKGVLLAGTRAHFMFERDGRKHWGMIWNNKTPALGVNAASFGCALMRQGVEANDNDLFEIIDVRHGQVFALSAAEADQIYNDLAARLKTLEDDYIRIAS